MKGLQIFMHSVRQVLGNLVPALQVSAVLYAAQVVVSMVLGTSGPLGIIGQIVNVVLSLWIAVGWYRYILLNEQPSIVPQLHMDRMIAVLIKGLIIGVILIIPAFALFLVTAPILNMVAGAGLHGFFVLAIVSALIATPLVTLLLMFAPAIAGTAVNGEGGLNAAFNATKADVVGVLVTALLLSLSVAALFLLGIYVFNMIPLGMMVLGIVGGWFVTMLYISVVATLYGHYVEKRALT